MIRFISRHAYGFVQTLQIISIHLWDHSCTQMLRFQMPQLPSKQNKAYMSIGLVNATKAFRQHHKPTKNILYIWFPKRDQFCTNKCIIPKKHLTSSLFFRPFYWGHLFKVFRSFLGLTFPDEESIIKSLMCLRLRVPAWPRNPANQLIRRLSTVIYHRFFSTIQTVVGNGNGISEACNSTSELE